MKSFYIAAVALAGFLFGLSGASIAVENSIKQVQVRRDGDQVLLKVQMALPLKALPGNWSVMDPPRVVLDFPDTDNQSGQTVQQVTTGDLKSVNLVQTEKLTRLVLNLYRPTKFSTEIAGDVLFITLHGQSGQASQEPMPSIYQPTSPKSAATQLVPVADVAAVRDVIFRRGEDGQAIINVELTDGTVPIDIRRVGAGLVVELRDVELPERLQNKRDVNDFATPVTTMSARMVGSNLTRFDIAARGRWFHQSHLTNNQLTIEVKPIPIDDVNKLVQAGQEGQRVSINFYGADATMVLRTLADISGKNVLVDPSLNGRTITANLDNIPYDQALEIIMSQVSAGMRVRNDVVLFGDRALLQKRDQDTADELTRAGDTAPLVTESFKLSYIKPSDLAALIRAGTSQGAASGAPVVPAAGGAAAGAPPAAGAAAPQGAGAAAQGMLSARGRVSFHDQTKKFFITDISTVVDAVRNIIREVDVPLRQVLVEARIVVATQSFQKDLGVRMNMFNTQQSPSGGGSLLGGGVRYAFGSGAGASNVDVYGAPAAPTLTLSNSVWTNGINLTGTSGVTLNLFNSAATRVLQLELAASESDNKTRAISSPRVVAQDGQSASMTQTIEDVITTQTTAGTGTTTISRVLGITVTPTIAPDGRVVLDLTVNKDDPRGAQGSLKNQAKTKVTVDNGGTVVIGGIYSEDNTELTERIPFFGDLPYVGMLFKNTQKTSNKTELLIFITPRIVSDAVTQR